MKHCCSDLDIFMTSPLNCMNDELHDKTEVKISLIDPFWSPDGL
jgi:hypothetical protein